MASVRAIVPGAIEDEKLFGPLAEALGRYALGSYELIIGTAEHADFAARTVRVAVPATGHAAAATRTLAVRPARAWPRARAAPRPACRGRRTARYDEARETLRATRARVAAARSVVVAGAGATGVEVAAELGFAYGGRGRRGRWRQGGDDCCGRRAAGAGRRRHRGRGAGGAGAAGRRGAHGRRGRGLGGHGGRHDRDPPRGRRDAGRPTCTCRPWGWCPTRSMWTPSSSSPVGWSSSTTSSASRAPRASGPWGDIVSVPRASYLQTVAHVSFLPAKLPRRAVCP